MAHSARTPLLSANWDLQVGDDGNLKMAQGGLATAQNCANEIRLWRNDAYFQRENGISWLEVQLARKTNEALLKGMIREACFRVPECADVKRIDLKEFDQENRILHGEIEIVTTGGESGSVEF